MPGSEWLVWPVLVTTVLIQWTASLCQTARVRDERRVVEEVVGSRLSESAQKARSGPRGTCSASPQEAFLEVDREQDQSS